MSVFVLSFFMLIKNVYLLTLLLLLSLNLLGPPAYDPSGATHYEGGVVAEVTSHVFQCHSLYEVYCNVAEWDDSLLAGNPNAEQEWNEAWVHLGACTIVDHIEPVTYEGDSSLSMP